MTAGKTKTASSDRWSVGGDERLQTFDGSLRDRLTGAWVKIKSGQLGPLPVLIGIVIVWVTFQSLNDRFLSPENMFNLARQISYGGMVSLGLVLMLLIREIDLSVGSMVGLSGAVLAILTEHFHWNPFLAIVIVILMGMSIGLIQGLIRTVFNVPSFLVTLGGFLILFGLQLRVLGSTGSIQIPFGGTISQIMTRTLSAEAGYIVAVVVVVGYGAVLSFERARYLRAGLPAKSWSVIALQAGLLAALLIATVWELNLARGVPIALIIFVGVVALVWIVTTQTRYGQHIFAIGGNPAAARRAGINVTAIRLSVFSLCGGCAAAGGVMSVAYIGGANIQLGASTLLLYAIAAAVIGGTSLFGGIGSAWAALLGWLVIGSIYNGMFILNLTSDLQSMMIGAVLIIAVVLDAMSRRAQRSGGED